MKKYMWHALLASIEAGNEILDVYSKPVTVELKEDRSPLTEADRRAHTTILHALTATELPVLSEEGRAIPYAERSEWELFWMVDPLDGTKEFIKRNGEFTVNIALIQQQQPIAGVVYAPVTGTLYFNIPGEGGFRIEKDASTLIELLKDSSLETLIKSCSILPCFSSDVFTIVASRSHMSAETEKFIEGLKSEHGEVNLVSKGSSLKLCLVAEGSAQIYPRFAPTMEWDTAAGHAVVAGMGKTVVQAENGQPLLYNKENLLNPWFIVQ